MGVSLHFTPYYYYSGLPGLLTVILYEAARGSLGGQLNAQPRSHTHTGRLGRGYKPASVALLCARAHAPQWIILVWLWERVGRLGGWIPTHDIGRLDTDIYSTRLLELYRDGQVALVGWLVRARAGVSLHFTPYYSGLLTVFFYEAARGSLADN